MNIYKSEHEIADLIIANRSISSEAFLSNISESEQSNFNDAINFLQATDLRFSKASINDGDLYYRKSIFVTTIWNKNDDIFDPEVVWAARYTPCHKPTNLGHKESDIVGHITSTWATTKDGALIPDNVLMDDLPGFYHLVNGSVIYTAFEDKTMRSRAQQLIADIEAGKKYVSMETTFANFDYGVVTPEGENYVVGRNKETAFLTKQLRAYGGTGQFDGCKVGRLLRNITFTGKGYVDNPANPHSIIFAESDSLSFTKAMLSNPFKTSGGVYINMNNLELEKNKMSDEKKTVESTAATLVPGPDIAQIVSDAVSKVVASDKAVAELNDKIDSLTKDLEVSKANHDKVLAERNDLAKLVTDLQSELTVVKANQVKVDRISVLTGKGVDKAVAEAKVNLLVALSDEQFSSVVDDIIKANTKASETVAPATQEGSTEAKKKEDDCEDEDMMEADAADKNADASVIDKAVADAKPEVVPNANPAAPEADKLAALRTEIAEALKVKSKSRK